MSDPMKTQMMGTDLNRTIVTSAPSINATQTIQPVQCPVCKTFNPVGMIYCVECGLLFSSALPDDAFGAPAVRPPCLVDSNGREHFLRPGSNIVGREGDILLQDTRVSRRHAEVTLSGSMVKVKDLGSTNGTKVGDQVLQADTEADVAANTELSFGGVTLVLSFPGQSAATLMPQSNKTQTMSATPRAEQAPAILEGDGISAPLKDGVNKIGRKQDNDVVIGDGYASGSHATLEVTESGLYYTDLGSTNGSTINGAKVPPNERMTVTPSDELEIGRTKVKIVLNNQ